MPTWREHLEQWSKAIAPHAIEPPELEIKPTASPQQVEAIETALGRKIPAPLRRFILEESAGVNFFWMLPEDAEVIDIEIEEDEQPVMGSIEITINSPFPRPEGETLFGEVGQRNPEEVLERWRSAVEFIPVGNGDAIALDLMSDPDNPPVIYMDHETAETHQLAESFEEFIAAWFSLGCVGPESWILRHFMTDNGKPLPEDTDGTPTSKVDPNCPNAKAFRAFFDL